VGCVCVGSHPELLRDAPINEERLELPAASEGEEIVFDYESLGLTLRRHPLALLRPRLARMKLQSAAELHDIPSGRNVRACGIVTVRQQPQTAHGTIFLTLEDETGPSTSSCGNHCAKSSAMTCSNHACSPSKASGSAMSRAGAR